jgi:signal transduction histidine kinase
MSQSRTETTSAQQGTAAERLGAQRAGVLAQIVELAAEALPGAEQVSLTVPTPQGLATAAATGPLARQVDAIQYQVGEGPCVAATREGDVVLVPDLATETRWPRFTSRMVGHSAVRSMLSLPLRTASGVAGSLNASAAAVGVFDDAGRIGSAFAAPAGLALAAAAERDRADNRVAQMESVVALLVHDLRSGMTVTRTAEDFLTGQRDRLDPDGKEALDLLGDELARQQRLLTELVDLVRAELPSTRAGALLPHVQQAVREHRHPVPVQPGPGATEVLVRMHPVRLRRILANLLDNADRHAGGATAVHVTCTGNRASVAVEDAGPGVPTERRESIFTRLAPSSSGEQGSHLGLALSRLHARLAGGDLRVEDRPDGGARFVLLLPSADLPTAAGRAGAADDSPRAGPHPLQRTPAATSPPADARGTGPPVGESAAPAEHRVAQRLAAVARALLHEPDLAHTLQRLVDAAAANLGLQVHASVSLLHKRRQVQTAAASDDRALRADQLQYELGEGSGGVE